MTTIYRDKALGLTIEGVGDQASDEATVFAYSRNAGVDYPAGWRPGLVSVLPGSNAGAEVDVLQGIYKAEAVTIELKRVDAVAFALEVQDDPFNGFAELGSPVTSLATTIPLDASGFAGRVVYVGSEAVRLGTFAGGSYVGCTRGVHGSRAQAHPAGSQAYRILPFLKGRRARLVVRDERGENATRYIGVVRSPRWGDNATTLKLELVSFFGAAIRVRRNKRPVDVRSLETLKFDRFRQQFQGTAPYSTRAKKIADAIGNMNAFEFDGGLVLARQDTTTTAFDGAVIWRGQPGGLEPVDDPTEQGALADLRSPMSEVLLIDRDLDEQFATLGTPRTVSASAALGEDMYNPVAIAFALLTSNPETSTSTVDVAGYDVFGGGFALDVGDVLEVSSWGAAIVQGRAFQIDSLVLGEGGSFEVLKAVVMKLLRPYGFIPVLTESGLLGVRKLETLNVTAFNDAMANGLEMVPESLNGRVPRLLTADGSASAEYQAQLGGAGSWDDSLSVEVPLAGVPGDPDFSGDPSRREFDFSTIYPRRFYAAGSSRLGDYVLVRLISDIVLAYQSLPSLEFTVTPKESVSLDLGRHYAVTVGDPVDPIFAVADLGSGTFERVRLTDPGQRARFAGMLVSRTPNFQSGAVDVRLLLTAWRTNAFARLRAPNAQVAGSVPVANQLDFNLGTRYAAPGGSDPEEFRVGDEVELMFPDGTPWPDSVVRSVVSVSPSSVVLDGWFAADPAAVSPSLILRLADFDDYDNDLAPGGVRPYAFLADAGGALGASDEQGDKYG